MGDWDKCNRCGVITGYVEDDIIIAKIEKLASLKAKVIISEEEFDDRKKQLLDKFTN